MVSVICERSGWLPCPYCIETYKAGSTTPSVLLCQIEHHEFIWDRWCYLTFIGNLKIMHLGCFFFTVKWHSWIPNSLQFRPNPSLPHLTASPVVSFCSTIRTIDDCTMLRHLGTKFAFYLMWLLPSVLGRPANFLLIHWRHNLMSLNLGPHTLVTGRPYLGTICF